MQESLRLGGDEPVSHEEEDLSPGDTEPDDLPSPIWVTIHPFGGRAGENLDSSLRRSAVQCSPSTRMLAKGGN